MAKVTINQLYDNLKEDGWVEKDFDNFKQFFFAAGEQGYKNRKALYDNMREDGYVDSPTYEDFMDKIDYKVGKSPSTSAATPMAQAVEESSSSPTEVTEQSHVEPQKPWQPSLQDKLRASWGIAQGVNNFKQGNKAVREKVKRQAEMITPEGRQKAKVAKASAKLVGADVETPLFGGGGSNAEDVSASASPQQPKAMPAMSPIVSGVKFQDGKPVTEWMLPDGTLTTNRQQVGAAEELARALRLQHEFEGRMREKGLDPSNPKDIQKQAIYEEVGQELEEAYREKEALEEALNKRKEELDKEHDNVGLGTRILRGLSEAAISSKDPHAIRDDSEARNYTADKQYNQLMAAIRHNRQAINILEDKRRGRMNEFWLNLGKEMVNGYTFDYGKGQLNDSRALNDAADLVDTINEKRRKGEALNEEEQTAELLLTSLARRNDTEGRFGGDYGAWARAGKMASHSIELLPDFAMGGMDLMGSITTKGLAKMGLNEVAKGFGNKVMRATGIGLGTLAGGAVMTNTIQAPRLLGQTAANMDGQLRMDSDGNYIIDGKEGFMTSFLKAQRELISENASEAVGEFLPSGKFVRELVGKGLEKVGLSKLNNTLASIGGKEWYQNTNIALKQMGFNGTVNEGLEEYAGIGYQTLMGDGDAFRSLADWDTHIDIWLGTVTMGALLNTPQYIGTAAYGAQYAKAKHGLNKNDKAGASVYGERWEGIKSQIDGMQNENVAGVLTTMLTDGTASSKEERQVLLDYAGSLQRMRGLNIGQMMGGSAQDAEVAQTYSSGYEASTPQEMVDAQNMYEYQRQRLVNELGSIGEENIENILAEVESDPVGALNKTYDPALRDIVMDYANAKTVRDGMIQRVNDDIDEQIAQSNAVIDGRINKESGLIVPATMGLDDRQVYVVSGNIVANDDGSIDRDASDESVIVRNAQTGELEFTDPRSLSSLGEAIDPEEERATATEAIRQQSAQAAVDAMNGTLAFNSGDVVQINDGNNALQATIIGPAVDEKSGMPVEGQVVVQLPDGQQTVFTKEQLQAFADAANLERINVFEQERAAARAQQQLAEAEANYEQGDSFKVTIENSEDTQHAIVMDQEGEVVTIWTPYPINERSDVASTMDGYITDVSRGELEGIIERDEQGNLVDYVAANPKEEIVGNAVITEDNSVNLQHGNGPEQNNDERAQPREADGGPVAPDPAGSLETSRDRSDIRVYEDGLAAKYNDYSEHSERDRREAESERLVGIAKSKGQYYDRKRIETLGEKRPKPSGESEIYVDAPKRRIYKVKNPYAKSPMKGNVQPEDAIYEHLVHNKYFPDTAYKFEGISDDLGDARIVLSQELVESVGQATKEQIDAALAEKGLLPEGKYTYGNDEISVTDVTGDNALLGNDGKVYFIDPIINFKKPVREILRDNKPAAEAAAPETKTISESEDNQPSSADSRKDSPKSKGSQPQIDDFGEKIAGARKDMLSALSRDLDNVTERALVELPLSKAIKRPDFSKAIETGAMTQEEAFAAEALWQTVYGSKKPAATRRNAVEIKKWASYTYQKVKRLQNFIEADSTERQDIVKKLQTITPADEETERAYFEKIKGYNSESVFAEPVFTPDPAAVAFDVMNRMGVAPDEKVNMPYRIIVSHTKQYYEAIAANGERMALPTTRDINEAVEEITLLCKMHRGDEDIIYPDTCFRIYGEKPILKNSGKFEVTWFAGRRGMDYKHKEFTSKEAAESHVATLKEKGIVSTFFEKKESTGEYESYRIKFINPINREATPLSEAYQSKADAQTAIAEKIESLSQEVNATIAKSKGAKTKAKEHFFVATIDLFWKRSYAVCRNKVGLRDYVDDPVIKEFDTRAEAEAWFKKNKDALEKQYADYLAKRRAFVYFDQKAHPRVGEDYRKGEDVTPEQFSESFGFRGVQFGNWTNGNDRQAALNEAYDAFMDLARVTGLSPRALSLNGELGLAFGARGSGSANAHYESSEVVINLTKTRGAGSLAHEWWHALDNYFMRKEGVPAGYATSMTSENMRPELRQAFKALTEAISRSEFGRRSDMKGEYWGRMIEKTARLFGEWVVLQLEKKGQRNHFLSRGIDASTIDMYRNLSYFYHKSKCQLDGRTPMSKEEFMKTPESLMDFPYPTPEELEAFDDKVQGIFDTLHQDTTGSGVILSESRAVYSRRRVKRSTPVVTAKNLFDFDFEEEVKTDSDADRVNSMVDDFGRSMADFLAVPEELVTDEMDETIHKERETLKRALQEYYSKKGSTAEEAEKRASELVAKIQAEVSVRTAHKSDAERFATRKGAGAEESYKTAGGEEVLFNGSTGLLPKLREGEYAMVERRFAINGGFDFSGKTTIESADDVAFIFRTLESYGTEQAFGVLVKDGKPTIIHVGSGSAVSTVVDLSPLRVANDMLGGADAIWLVHNHPSGTLKASPQDANLQRKLELMFPGKMQDAIIMDTKRGLYATFDTGGKSTERQRKDAEGNITQLPTYSFSGQVFAEDFNFDSLTQVRNSQDVAAIVAAHRLGESDKTGVLLLNNANKVVGNILCSQAVGDAELPRQIADYALSGGATRVIIYGRDSQRSSALRKLKQQISELSGDGIALLDSINIKNRGSYESAADNGVLEPEAEYGRDKQGSNQESSDTLERQGDGYGAYSDAEVSYLNDTASKLAGKNRFSKKRQAEFAARERQRMADRIQELAEHLHLNNVEVMTDTSQLEGKRAEAKGFFNKRTGKITIVLPNNYGKIDAEQTLLHEAVAHYGLRKLFGKHFDTFLNNVYESAEPEIRRKIAAMAAKYGWDFRTATEEYLAGLAEDTNFDEARAYGGWWSRIKRLFLDMLEKIGFEGFRDNTGIVITDNELRYLLWRSYENLRGRDKGIFRDAADVVKQVELKVGNYAEGGIEADYAAEPTDVGSINAQFNQELQQYEEGKLPQGHRFELGMPSAYLRSAGFPNLPISMRSTLLATKAKMNRHPFDALNLKGLVEALQKPIAIFEYSKPNMRNLIVDVKRGDKHFLVGVTLNYKAGDIEINSVSGLFPKDSLEWLKWIQDGKAIRIDQKEKVQAIIDSQRTTNTVESERIGLNLDDAAKIVKSFENPTAEGEELFRGAEGSARKEYDERVRTKVVDKEKMKNKSTNRAAQLNEAYLDSMRSLKVLQEAVSHESGKPIEDFENAYMAENEMSSRNKIAEEVYKRDFFRPMCDAVAEVTKGKDKNYRGLLDYIIAKHGLERNEYMRQKSVENGVEQSEADNTDYAGLTALTGTVNVADAERAAQQMVLDYENSHDTANLWKRINAATAESLRIRYQGGLLSKDVYEKIKTQYNYYIPLKGWKETTALDAYEYSVGGYGLSSALMTAFGRDSIADDPLATIMVDAQRTIMEANRNVMKQHFLNLALNHQTNLLTLSRQWYILDADGEWRPDDKLVIPPDADAGLVDSLVRKREQELLDLKKQGKATTRRNGLKLGMIQGDAIENQHVVKVKRNGETFCIYVNGDPRAALAINGMLNPDSGQKRREIKYAQAVKNFMSKAFTTWNPEFVVGNLSRDLMFAGVAVATKESKAYAANYTKNISSLFFNYRNMLPGLLYKWEHGELNDKVEVERLFREFLMNGGETGFTQLNTVENAKRDMQRFLKEARGGASRLPRKAWRSFWNGVEFLNRSAEDTTRFAVYMTSRQQGRSVNRSIYDAKEITVNFNKKGSGAWGAKYLNFFYVFFNAAMQALANAGRLVYRNPGKASIAMGVFMSSGFLLPLISNIMAGLWGGGDGDDDYWNMPEWVRRNNLVIYIPFTKKYLTIPIAHELRPFYGIGEIAYSILCGKETVEDGLWKAVEGFTGLLPVDYTGNGGNLKANFAPTILQPIVQVDQNVNYFGKPIYRNTPWNEDQPEWTKTYKSTSGLLVDASRMLSEALSTTDEYGVKHYPEHWYTGDVNPAVVEHLLESYTGGLGKTVNGFGKTISMLWNEDARELRNVPVARKFIQSSDERAEERRFSNEYFKLRDQYDESKKYLRELGNLDDEGAMGVANRVDKWLDTDAGKRYELMDGFFKEVNSYQRALNQENNESIRNLIQHDIDSVRHKLVATIDSLNVAEAKRQ